MFKANKYTKVYYQIVESAKKNGRTGYTENHHIVPKCIGGSDEKENLVHLSYREHYICHALLTKMYDSPSLINAFWAMSNKNRERYYRSRLYEQSKRLYVESISGNSHWAKTEEFREAVSKSWNDDRRKSFSSKVSGDNHWTRKTDMIAHSEMMRKSLDIEKMSKEKSLMMKTRNPMKNPEIAVKFRKPKEKVICPHCGKIGGKPVMIRYHFDNCKEATFA